MSVTVTTLPGNLNYAVVQGATFRSSLVYRAGGSPVDLTDFTAKLQIRDQAGGNLLCELTTDVTTDGGITLGGSAGTIALVIADEQTTSFPIAIYVYDLQLTSGSGDVTYLVEGQFDVKARVTT
jgi:hypothetical protein